MTATRNDPDHIFRTLKKYFLQREVVNFYEYLAGLEEGLGIRRQALLTNIDLAQKSLSELGQNDERRSELLDLKIETEQLTAFTNILRQSFLTSLYSFMELWLVRECFLDSKRRDGGKTYRALVKLKPLQKVKQYFSHVTKSAYPFSTSEDWVWVTNFQLLRNCIVHRQGSLSGFSDFKVDSTLAKFREREDGLDLFGVNNDQILVQPEFCIKALQTAHRFMVELLSL